MLGFKWQKKGQPMPQLIPVYKHKKNDDRPLPERLIDEIGGSMTIYELDNGERLYCIRDWVYYISGSTAQDVGTPWHNLKRKLNKEQLKLKGLLNLQTLSIETDGGPQKMDFTNERGLYLLTQRMSDRSQFVQGIKKYLADAGVYVDRMAQDINRYKNLGKSENWIEARVLGKVTRHQFTAALQRAVAETLTSRHYSATTETIYVNLWERTTEDLRNDLNVGEKAKLRDHMGEFALIYLRITEAICTKKLNDVDLVPFHVARDIVAEVARAINKQAKATSQLLGIDLVTDRPLLED
jgi:hypothetical protein